MERSSNCISYSITIFLLAILFACSESPAPAGENNAEAFSLPEEADHSEREGAKKDMPPLRYDRVVLILGGSPSLSPGGRVEVLYSQMLQQRVGDQYKVLNASVAGEAAESLKERLPYLFKHDIQAVVLEMGHDEYQSRLGPKAFRQKLESVLQHESLSPLPLYLLLTAPGQKYRNAIKDLTGLYGLELILADFPLSDTPAWHESAASLLESHLEIVR